MGKKKELKRVILESPYSASGGTGSVEANEAYARRALRDSLLRGEAPLASHLLYPEVLDDDVPKERTLGIDAGHAWLLGADLMVVYADWSISPGMTLGIERAAKLGVKIEFRYIGRVAPKLGEPSE